MPDATPIGTERYRRRHVARLERRVRTGLARISNGWMGLTGAERLALVAVTLTPITLLLDYRLGFSVFEMTRTFNSYVENFGLPVSYQQVFGTTQACWLAIGAIALAKAETRRGFATFTCACLLGLCVLLLLVTASLEGIDGYTELALASTLVPLVAMVGVLFNPSIRTAPVRILIFVFLGSTALVTVATLLLNVAHGTLSERFDLFLFGSPTYTGSVLGATLVLTFAVGRLGRGSALMGVVFGVGLLLTETRGAQIAAVCGLLVLAFGDRRLRVVTLATLTVLLVAFVVFSDRSLIGLNDSSYRLRGDQIARHWQLFLNRPTYGYGLAADSVPFTSGSDNTILGLANAAGAGAAVLWLAGWAQPLIAALARMRQEPAVVGAAGVFIAVFVAWMVTGGEVLTYAPPTNLLPLILALALARSVERQGPVRSEQHAVTVRPTMKVLLTVERYAPEIGGAERVVQRVAEGLATRGHSVSVMTGGRRTSGRLGGVAVERFPIRGNANQGMRGDVQAPLEYIRRALPDVVLNYAAQTWATDLCTQFLNKPRPPALVLAPCGFSALHSPDWAPYFEDLRRRLPQYDALIFHSSQYQDWDFAVSAGAQRLHVIPNGADPAPDPRRRKKDCDRPLVLTVGSHVRSKGHRDFARLLRSVRRTRSVHGLIVAPTREGLDAVRGCQLRCHARHVLPRNGLKVVDGRVRENVDAAFASADVFLLPSQVECSPLVIIEAMAAGVPWISYDVGNVRELAGGIVVDDLAEMAARAQEVLDGKHPRLGTEGRRAWDQHHRWESLIPRYERVLQLALERSERASSLAVRAQ